MIKVFHEFDPINNNALIRVNTKLLEKHALDFSEIYYREIGKYSSKKLPENLRLILDTENSEALIAFDLPKSAVIKREANNDESVLVDPDLKSIEMKNLNLALDLILRSFISTALSQEVSTKEFIPLKGYSFSKLQKEIQDAVKKKRTLCIVDTYTNYLNMCTNKFKIQQYLIEPNTEEYADAAIMLYKKEVDKFRNTYASKLSLTEWI